MSQKFTLFFTTDLRTEYEILSQLLRFCLIIRIYQYIL